ncbi:hypothetical protein ACFL6U_05635 [Planctomycetota bacterium]
MSRRRDRFIERWCFEPLGGHYHGFLRGELVCAFRDAGFSIENSGVFYVIEPIQIPFLYTHTLCELITRKDWSKSKRSLAAIIYIGAHPLNKLMKTGHLFANNLYVVAKKDSR